MRSSLLFTMSRQYDELFHYSAQVTLADNALPEERAAVEDFLAGDSRIVNYIPCAASSATVVTPSYSTTAYVEVMASERLARSWTFSTTRAEIPSQWAMRAYTSTRSSPSF